MTTKQVKVAEEIRDLEPTHGLDRACVEWARANLPANVRLGAQYAKACWETWLKQFKSLPKIETGHARDCTEENETWGASYNDGWRVED